MKILIASFPKSGSTYLAAIFERLPRFRRVVMIDFEGTLPQPPNLPEKFSSRREQELSHHLIKRYSGLAFLGKNVIAKHHVTASMYTMCAIKQYRIEVIVLVRNIYDCLVSLADHISIENHAMPWAFWPASIANKSFEYRVDAVVDLVSPWYLKFYASWSDAAPDRIVRYEDVVLGGKAGLVAMFDQLKLSSVLGGLSHDQINDSIGRSDKAKERFNVGVRGRGAVLSKRQIDTINRYASYYEGYDFSPIGLRSNSDPSV